MSEITIKIKGIGKKYVLGKKKSQSFRNSFSNLFTNQSTRSEEFWALKDISFNIKKGEVTGIVGKNGAGKSTLLKILSQITKPTKGIIEVEGRLASLLEVGTGFHPELTGEENIYLNGTILGMSRKEVKSKFDEIVDFSGVEKFLHTPVKRYSSGMYVRLAFSVAAHLSCEVMVIDEVLAVGDFDFQKKCLGKMKNIANEGKTVLFVSHNMAAVKSLCTSGILLDHGRLTYKGDVDTTIKKFLSNRTEQISSEIDLSNHIRQSGIEEIRFSKIIFDKDCYQPYDDIKITLFLDDGKKLRDYTNVKFGLLFLDQYGNKIYHISNIFTEQVIPKHFSKQNYSFLIKKNSLSAGEYQVHLWLGTNEEEQDCITEGVSIKVMQGNVYNFTNSSMIHGVVQPKFKFMSAETNYSI